MMAEHTVNVFGGRLAAARRLRGISQRRLARDIGLSNVSSYVSHMEAGRRLPTLAVLVELCKRLEVSADYLLGATPPIQAPGEQMHRPEGT
jgi:transcriptional regulator with XRE-family HTH domain